MDENLKTSAEAHAEEALASIATAPAAETPSLAAPAISIKAEVMAILASIRDRENAESGRTDTKSIAWRSNGLVSSTRMRVCLPCSPLREHIIANDNILVNRKVIAYDKLVSLTRMVTRCRKTIEPTGSAVFSRLS
jgi:hypothetical protein